MVGSIVANFQNRTSIIQMRPTVHFPTIEIVNVGNDVLNVTKTQILKCSTDIDVVIASDFANVHWTLNRTLFTYVSHFEVQLVKSCSGIGCETEVVPYQNVGANFRANISMTSNLVGGEYVFKVRACFGELCTDGVESDGFTVESKPPVAGIVTGEIVKIGTTCTDFEISFETFICDSANQALFYRWTISGDTEAKKILLNYTVIEASATITKTITVCSLIMRSTCMLNN